MIYNIFSFKIIFIPLKKRIVFHIKVFIIKIGIWSIPKYVHNILFYQRFEDMMVDLVNINEKKDFRKKTESKQN